MKVLTAQQMREADRQTIEQGTPGDVLMARAGTQVVEFLESEFSPLSRQRVVIFCGTGNNGGDGLVVGRLLKTRVASLQVVRATDTPGPVDRDATIVVDALLGTGFREPVEGRYAELIATINQQFPRAKVVAVDIPSAMQVHADFTVTFAAPNVVIGYVHFFRKTGASRLSVWLYKLIVTCDAPVHLACKQVEYWWRKLTKRQEKAAKTKLMIQGLWHFLRRDLVRFWKT